MSEEEDVTNVQELLTSFTKQRIALKPNSISSSLLPLLFLRIDIFVKTLLSFKQPSEVFQRICLMFVLNGISDLQIPQDI